MEASENRLEALRRHFTRVPVNRHLGLRLLQLGDRAAEAAMDPLPELLQDDGILHGGAIGSLADTAAIFAVYAGLPEGKGAMSIEHKLNFLRPVRSGDGEVIASGRVLKLGRNVACSEAEVQQAGRLVAKGLFTYLVIDLD